MDVLDDAFEDVIQIPHHLGIAKSQHMVAELLQMLSASLVVLLLFIVVCSVDFDDEAVFGTAEVEDVWTDRILATKLQTVETATSDRVPENGLSAGGSDS